MVVRRINDDFDGGVLRYYSLKFLLYSSIGTHSQTLPTSLTLLDKTPRTAGGILLLIEHRLRRDIVVLVLRLFVYCYMILLLVVMMRRRRRARLRRRPADASDDVVLFDGHRPFRGYRFRASPRRRVHLSGNEARV